MKNKIHKYDFLIIGSGLIGSIAAYSLYKNKFNTPTENKFAALHYSQLARSLCTCRTRTKNPTNLETKTYSTRLDKIVNLSKKANTKKGEKCINNQQCYTKCCKNQLCVERNKCK